MLGRALAGRRGMDGESVDAALELAAKRLVDHAVALEPALPAEHLGHDIDPEMSFSTRPVSGVPDVLVGFVQHPDALGRESLGQLLRDEIAPRHAPRIAVAVTRGQRRFAAGNGQTRLSRLEGAFVARAY
jgi:hypothetical protein